MWRVVGPKSDRKCGEQWGQKIEPRAGKSENGRAATKRQEPPFTLTGHKPKLTNTGPLEIQTNSRQRVPTLDAGKFNYQYDAIHVGRN